MSEQGQDERKDGDQVGTGEPEQKVPKEETKAAEVFETIRLVLLSFSILFAMLLSFIGFIGWRTLGDLDEIILTTVDREVGRLVSENEDNVSELSSSIAKLVGRYKELDSEIEQLKGGVAQASEDLELIRSGDTDPVGDFLRLQQGIESGQESLIAAETRKRAEIVFSKLLRTNAQGSNTGISHNADTLFNASGLASSFQMTTLAYQLAEAAANGQPTPEHYARMYRTKIVAGELTPEIGFTKVFELVENFEGTHLIHLTLSEAYNVSLSLGRFREFDQALVRLDERLGENSPSYIQIIQAQAKILEGSAESTEGALEAMRKGLAKAQRESPAALWLSSTIQDGNQVLKRLQAHPTYRSEVEQIRQDYMEILQIDVPASQQGSDSEVSDLLESLLNADPFPSTPQVVNLALEIQQPRNLVGEGWHWFEFSPQLTAIYTLTADAQLLNNDPVVIVRSSNGDLIGYDDDGGGGLNSKFEPQLISGDTYHIGVGPARGETIAGSRVEIRIQGRTL